MGVDRFPLFPQAGSPVVLILQDVQRAAAELSARVGTGEYALPVQAVGQKTSFDLFDQPLEIGVGATAGARIHPKGAKLDPFATGEALEARSGTSWSELELVAHANLAGSGSTVAGSFTLSARLAAEARLGYRRLLPVPSTETRLGAFLSLAAGSRLPGHLDLRDLAPGEVHRYVAHLALSLDLAAAAGLGGELKRDVGALTDLLGSAFAGVSGEVLVRVDASFKATLGLALSDDVEITVGRAGTLRPARDGWVRVRIERASERRFSAGAVFAVQVRYQAAGAATAILDRAFGLLVMPRALESFMEVNALLAGGEWDEVKGRLSARAESLIAGWLDDTGWREKLAGSPEIQRLVSTSARVVDAYSSLGAELQSLFGRLLGTAELGAGSKLRVALQEIADLDGATLRRRLLGSDPDLAAALSVLELLTGKSLEEVVLSSDSDLGRVVAEAKALAGRAVAFLDRLDGLPGEVLGRFEELAESTGIAAVVSWLAANATSVEQLEGAIDQRFEASVERVVERLTGKLFGLLSEAEKERIERWATRLDELLSTDELEARLRAAAAKLDGELGFSLALELERLTRETALLDLELDPRDAATHRAVSAPLGSGAIGEILQRLPEPKDDDPPPYRLRECVFVSRRVRSAAISLLASFAGGRSSRSRWITERTIRVTQEAGGLTRHGRWDGGFVRSETAADADLFESGVWISARADGAGGDLDATYATPEIDLRLTLEREDQKTTGDELVHYRDLLDQLGFQKVAGDPDLPNLAPGTSLDTRFALALRLPQGLQALLAGVASDKKKKRTPADWGDQYLDAARRWWDDPLVTRPSSDVTSNQGRVRLGRVLAALAGDPDFRKVMLGGPAALRAAFRSRSARVGFAGTQVTLRLMEGGQWRREYVTVPEVADRVNKAYRRGFELAKQLEVLAASPGAVSAGDLDELSEQVASTFAAATVTLWSSPALAFWFVLARLSRQGQQTLAAGQGLATLRWRSGADAEWEAPIRWVLDGQGLSGLRRPGGAFG